MGVGDALFPIVAFDESGNTGENLLDRAQPLYCLASVHLELDQASRLAATNSGQGQELRFARLRRSDSGRQRILTVLRARCITSESARITPVHKPFMVAAKLFDLVMEPTLHESGINVYERGFHKAYANILYRRGPNACGEDAWLELMASFVAAVRSGREEAVDRLMRAHRVCQLSANDLTVRQLLDLLPPEIVGTCFAVRSIRWRS